ncbi:MAG: bifunctional UDP-N-acetylmuramoyl-tripeptide:D-alanyl-D-alanine ligase/alanine racemase, partial [Flavobacteriales bacterium]|nr:bifunctional UDP-N-acetylmuramoyl-tripeptide:D-alanyl-D-alanine ligase/alanine racemase [Flavobacteriales bacterium]
RHFLISQEVDLPEDAFYIKVPDVLAAVQNIAKHFRKTWKGEVIAITGSNGKTTVKEWLNEMLFDFTHLFRSPRSYNSQIGVPLSILTPDTEYHHYFIEAGISMPNEMGTLQDIIAPDWGIWTNLGLAHVEHFEDKKALGREKAILFKDCSLVIHPQDSLIEDSLQSAGFEGKHVTWGTELGATLRVINSERSNDQRHLIVSWGNDEYDIWLQQTDRASEQNALCGILAAICCGMPIQQAIKKAERVQHIGMRMERVRAEDGTIIINDVYSADVKSFELALEELKYNSKGQGSHVILSDFPHSENIGHEFYSDVFSLMQKYQIESWWGVGPELQKYGPSSAIPNVTFDSVDSLIKYINKTKLESKYILIKGARKFALEKIVQVLQVQHHRTVLEIRLDQLVHNLNQFKQKLKPSTKLMVMVKAFGYGAGAQDLAKTLEYEHVDYLGVAYIDEGVALRKDATRLPIMVMNAPANQFSLCSKYELEPVIHHRSQLEELKRLDTAIAVHVELNTGMNRLGFGKEDLRGLISQIEGLPENVNVKSIFSHLVASDKKEHDEFTRQQLSDFAEMSKEIKEVAPEALLHISNTGGINRWPEAELDMVRLGIGIYGVDSSENIEPVATLKSSISQINHVKPGESVGYNRNYIAEANKTIATISIGYADGYNRLLGNGNGHVLVNGQLAPVVGDVCMDMTMIDVTDIPCNVGNEVVLFGSNPRVQDLAKAMNTISYEVLSGISQRVKRVYIHE